MKVLISGAGAAGATAAYWLAKRGVETTLLMPAPAQPGAGPILDFWGSGYDVAERMRMLPALERIGGRIAEIRHVDAQGRVAGAISLERAIAAARGRYLNLARGDLIAALHAALPSSVRVMNGVALDTLVDTGTDVHVGFQGAPAGRFDLVIGADGAQSPLRARLFGADGAAHYLGHKAALFEIDGYQPRDEGAQVTFHAPRLSVSRVAWRGGRTFVQVVIADDSPEMRGEESDKKAFVRSKLAGAGWECAQIAERLEASLHFTCGPVSQVRAPSWAKGRVALAGDAAAGLSMLSGEGASLAMLEGYVLAGEIVLMRADHRAAFARYHARLAPLVAQKQKEVALAAQTATPRSRFGVWVRNMSTRAMHVEPIAKWAVDASFKTRMPLPEYADAV